MHYRIGWLCWKFLARLGVPTYLRIKVLRDPEASVFIATSPDLQGLVIEAETMNELIEEAQAAIDMLLGEYLPSANYAVPEIRMKIASVAA